MDLLFKLPIEISNLVIDLLDRDSLTNLRLVCKKAQHIATPAFGRKYLHTLRVIFVTECLDALVEISENKLLREYVKRILCASHTLRDWVHLTRILFDCDPVFRKRMMAAHKHCIKKHQPLIASDQHIELISQALANFRDAEVLPALGIFDNKHSNASAAPIYKGWGGEPHYRELFDTKNWYRASGEVLSAVIKAANLSNYPLESIVMDLGVAMTIPLGTREASKEARNRVEHILANILPGASLCNSKLNFRFDIVSLNNDHMLSRLDIDFQNRRLGFQSLQHSEVTNYAYFRGLAGLGKLATTLGTNMFCEVDLSRCEAKTCILSNFLQAHSGSLKRLRLSQIVFRRSCLHHETCETVSAADFLKTLKDDLKHLDYLELEHLESSDASWSMLPLFAMNTKMKGRQDIESRLAMWL